MGIESIVIESAFGMAVDGSKLNMPFYVMVTYKSQ